MSPVPARWQRAIARWPHGLVLTLLAAFATLRSAFSSSHSAVISCLLIILRLPAPVDELAPRPAAFPANI